MHQSKDVSERNSQVAIMSEIYESAKEVVVYLGDEYEDSKTAIEYLKSHEFAYAPKSNFPQDTKTAVTHLLQRPWFSRIWVLQEVKAAKHSYILCGNDRMDFFQFTSSICKIFKEMTLWNRSRIPLVATTHWENVAASGRPRHPCLICSMQCDTAVQKMQETSISL